MLVNCLTATLVNRLTAKLVVVNLVKLHLTKFTFSGFGVNVTKPLNHNQQVINYILVHLIIDNCLA